MSSAVFRTIRLLEDAQLHYRIDRSRPDSIRLSVTMVGQRLEIDVFEDDHIEVSRFIGDEAIEGGWEVLKKLTSDD
jgi:hypothetical protein